MRQRVLWLLCGMLMVGGATWLVALVWTKSELGGASHVPHVLGGLLAGVTLARVLDRRPLVLAALSAFGWIAVVAPAYLVRGDRFPWSVSFDVSSGTYLGIAALGSTIAAVAGAALRVHGRNDHKLMWLWISGLVTLGCLVTFVFAFARGPTLAGIAIIGILAAPVVAGGLVQVMAPIRMIWTCGGGMLILVFVALDDSIRDGRPAGDAIGTILGLAIFVLLGALGARIAWRLFRHGEAPPATTVLPTAITREG